MEKLPDAKPAAPPLPKQKQTSLGLYLTAQEAYKMWKSAPQTVKVLDVRTPHEYVFVGHAEMARNIPLLFVLPKWDPEKNELAIDPNPNFLSEVKQFFTPRDTLLVMCRSGGRSALAVNQLASAGYLKVYNIIDGMEGDKVNDPTSAAYGKRAKNGWKNSDLPWTYAVDPKLMSSLSSRLT